MDTHSGAGLFPGFTLCSLRNRLMVFHEAGGQCPRASAGFYGPFAEQDFILMGDQTAGNDIGILIMNKMTGSTYMPRVAVTLRHLEAYIA